MIEGAKRFTHWMKEQALPHFLQQGIYAEGEHAHLFYETLPVTSNLLRSRVQTRQLFVFAHASARGWIDAQAVVLAGIKQTQAQFQAANSPALRFALTPDSASAAALNCYEQAFALLAYSELYHLTADEQYRQAAHRLHDWLQAQLALSAGGYAIDEKQRDALSQNPNMHLFEACLHWWQLTGDKRWQQQSQQLYKLFCHKLFDKPRGCLVEFFAEDWRYTTLSVQVDPGHHHEWTWLLYQYQGLSGVNTLAQRRVLQRFAQQYGENPQTGAVMSEVLWEGNPYRAGGRLWCQTERIKADVVNYRQQPSAEHAALIDQHVDLMFAQFIDGEPAGLYCDEIDAQGQRIPQSAPASTLYHLYLACQELQQLADEQASN